MDVHDSLGTDGTEPTQTMWEPPGYDADSSTGTDPNGYDGYDDGTDAGGSTDDGSTGAGDGSGTAGDGGTAGTTDGGTDGGTEGGATDGTMIVEVDGETRELPTERDYTGDGKPDAMVETADGKVIVFADTENNETGAAGPDGKADEAYVVDKGTGQVVGAAHIDPDSGTWVEGTDADGPSAVGSTGTPGSGTEAAPAGGSGQGGPTEGGSTEGGSAGPADGTAPGGVVTVDYDGHEIGVQKTIDTDGDGVADSGVLYADGRTVVVTDTDGDPDAEQIALVDAETGRITEVAHVDPRTGEWEEGPAPEYTDGGTGSGATETGTETGTETTGTPAPTGDRMTVEVGGQTQEVPLDRDYTGDGRPDAAVETKDGNVIVFADTENNETGAAGPDGKADEAWIVDKSTGQVVGAAHVDPRTGEWVDGADSDGPSSAPAATTGQASS